MNINQISTWRYRLVYIAVALLIFATLAFAQSPETNTKSANVPLVSATNPAYLSCTFWTGKRWTDFTPRSARTRLIEAPNGFRAYGRVSTFVKNSSCENATSLFVSKSLNHFKLVYKKEGDGNGIRLLGWSPNSEQLLTQVNLWVYESDSGFTHLMVLYDFVKDHVTEISIDDIIDHSHPDCGFESTVQGWATNTQIKLIISPPPADPSFEEQPCFKKARVFIYDLEKKALLQFH